MGAETPNQAATATGAVFLSYASQDADATRRIRDALRNAGIEVWLDQSELRGGDAWDQSIRTQIKNCTLFVPIISQHTHERAEGYFRLEWKLAVDRCHLMAADKAFLVPVVIDDTPDDDERVPERFRELQWTRLPDGNARPEFVTRIRQLLSGKSGHSPIPARTSAAPSGLLSRLKPAGLAIAVVLAALAAYLLAEKPWAVKPPASFKPATSADIPTAFNPPPHSIAVLPFVNMSADKEQEYFSDGLSEELLNSLSRVDELQVAARTSSFYFKGEHADLPTIAHKLNVASVLEGSVRRAGHTIRVTAQLNNAVTGFHLWSQTYDRDLGDVLEVQTEIANAVAAALKVTLLRDAATKVELGGTRSAAAFDAYLRARRAQLAAHGVKDYQTAIADFTEALGLDPNYALAFAHRSLALSGYANEVSGPAIRESYDKARVDALKAIALTPDLAEGHLALAYYSQSGLLDFNRANEAYERALALAPGNAQVLRSYAYFAVNMGRTDAAIVAARRAVVLDPLNRKSHFDLGLTLFVARHYQEAIGAFQDALNLDPEYPAAHADRGFAYYALGDLERARASCERKPDFWASQQCLAVTYHKLSRHRDAESMVAKLKASLGDAAAFQYAETYAQWGNRAEALDWLDSAMRVRDPGLEYLKTDPLLDPLRKEPRFQAIERALKFPTE